MAELTLLEMTQDVLSSLDSDSVNSIGDTVESMQVATIIKNKYYDMQARGNLPEQNILFQLDPSLDEDVPVKMTVPAGTNRIEWIKYFDSNPLDNMQQDQFGSFSHDLNVDIVTSTDTSSSSPPGYKYVTILPIDQFLDFVNQNNLSDSDVIEYTFAEGPYNFRLKYRDDKFPQYCTIIENDYVLFDSFDADFDTTLQASKSMVYGYKVTPFRMEDTFVPDMDDNQFPLLLNEAKSLAFYELKQTPHMKADQEIKRQWSTVQKDKSVINRPNYFDQLANFGRVPRTGGYSGGGYGAYKWMRQSGP